ncbi:MAG: hypothetical protein U0T83_07460 [Bacteriovoracaceae bacterium]
MNYLTFHKYSYFWHLVSLLCVLIFLSACSTTVGPVDSNIGRAPAVPYDEEKHYPKALSLR